MDEQNRAEFNDWLEWHDRQSQERQRMIFKLVDEFVKMGLTAKDACRIVREVIEKADNK